MATERPVAEVLQDILCNFQEIVRSEVRLAKAELREEARQSAVAGIWMTAGVVGALSAWMFLLWTGAYALATVMSPWAATLAVALLMACTAGGLIAIGIGRFKRIQPIPKRTVETLKENLEWMKQPTK